MIKKDIKIVNKNGINYIYRDGKKVKYKPWLGDILSFIYDFIMKKSVFPKKFDASIQEHEDFLKKELSTIHDSDVLELATGSGNMSELLDNDNKYIGIDISKGLLKKAKKKFKDSGFKSFKLYVANAELLPFSDNLFDVVICNISFNFFDNPDTVIKEIKRVIKRKGTFICSVPVPERNRKENTIRGKLFTEQQLKEMFNKHGFTFRTYTFQNGALLYFKAILN